MSRALARGSAGSRAEAPTWSRAAACLSHAVLAGLLLAAGEAWSQEGFSGGERKQVRALRIDGSPPRIDGRLDEAVWGRAEAVSDFAQREPDEGAPAQERTEVMVLFGSDALYVGARMFSAEPLAIRAPVSRRDNGLQAEHVLVSLDTYLDRRTAYTFGVTASGVRLDWHHPTDSRTHRNASFDPVWEARARIDSLGWTAEMRIPFSQLRFGKDSAQTWGININRWTPSRNEDVYWIVVPTKETGWASRFGDLVGIEGIRPSRRIEMLPYAASGASYTSQTDAANPFDDGSRYTTHVGGDLKMGIGPSLTLEGTANPDFGQVEADAAEVNLTAYESFFPEKRPFFIEGGSLLAGGGRSYFYSRRIGARPVGPAAGDHVDYPSQTTILGAGKLTGRLPSRTSVGGLVAFTGEERARTYDGETGLFGRVPVARPTRYGVLRLQQEFGPSASTAGISLTGVQRDLSGGRDLLSGRLNRSAYAGGADWNLRLRGGEYEVSGHLGFSAIQGDSTAMIRAQRSSVRYFQRPDADYVRVDSTRTSMSGYTAGLSVSRNSGRHWLWDASLEAASPGFEINDLGLLISADDVWGAARLRYRETKPGSFYRNYQTDLSVQNLWNFGGVRNYSILSSNSSITWKNFWRTSLTAYVEPPSLDDALSWGGPLVGTGWGGGVVMNASSSSASKTRVRGSAHYASSELGYLGYGLSGGVTVRRGTRWELSADPNYSWETSTRQFITSRDGGRPETFGRRYIFSFIDRSTLATQFRLNYTLTPDLTLELYAEPFAARGRYYRFGELSAPGSRRLRVYGQEGTTAERQPDGSVVVTDGGTRFTLPYRDFNVLSFRSNSVLRWEWRPGSTLFLVWQQDRFAHEATGELIGLGSLLQSVEARGDNRLVLKVSYWLPIG